MKNTGSNMSKKPLFEALDHRATIPVRATAGSAGYDLSALEDVCLHNVTKVRTGLRINLPAGTCGLVLPRSGLATKHGVTIINSPGLIDEDYEGEIIVSLWFTKHGTYQVHAGDRIAQLVVTPYVVHDIAGDTTFKVRGAGGHGSTGT